MNWPLCRAGLIDAETRLSGILPIHCAEPSTVPFIGWVM
jgi:hypothetical protein